MLEKHLCRICKRTCDSVNKVACLSDPKLNLGSGFAILKNHINFDLIDVSTNEGSTDILGNIKKLRECFPDNVFSSIFCSHVLEHFYPQEAKDVLSACFCILKPGGTITIECPDIEKIMKLFLSGKTTVQQTTKELYGDSGFLEKYGDFWMHKWGYTAQTFTDVLSAIGFSIKSVENGISHHHPERDFRIIGVKK